MKSKNTWFFIALCAALLTSPNSTIIRVAVDTADPYYWTLIRFIPIALVCMPFVIKSRHKLRNALALRYVLITSVAMSIAITVYTLAILHSQASYVSLITLVTPIIFILLSLKLFKEKVTRQAIGGVTLAAIGAMIIFILPLALSNQGTAFYPLASVLALTNSVLFSIGLVYMRKANEEGVSMPTIIGISAWMTVLVSAVLFFFIGDWSRTPFDQPTIVAMLYSGVVVALIARALNIWSYERLGPLVISALGYLEIFIAILIPVIFIGEKLSVEMVVGGIFILLGVYVVEVHKYPHFKHHIIHRYH